MVEFKKIYKVKEGKKFIEEYKLMNLLNQLKKGHKFKFKDRIDFLLVDDFLNSQKIAYYIDNVNQSIWL